jgi:hypothetical protein
MISDLLFDSNVKIEERVRRGWELFGWLLACKSSNESLAGEPRAAEAPQICTSIVQKRGVTGFRMNTYTKMRL